MISGVGNPGGFRGRPATVAVAETAAAAGAGAAAAGSATQQQRPQASPGWLLLSQDRNRDLWFRRGGSDRPGPPGYPGYPCWAGPPSPALDAGKGQVAATETALQEQSRGPSRPARSWPSTKGWSRRSPANRRPPAAAGWGHRQDRALRAAFANASDSEVRRESPGGRVGLDDLVRSSKNREEAKAPSGSDRFAEPCLSEDGSIGLLSGTSTADGNR